MSSICRAMQPTQQTRCSSSSSRSISRHAARVPAVTRRAVALKHTSMSLTMAAVSSKSQHAETGLAVISHADTSSSSTGSISQQQSMTTTTTPAAASSGLWSMVLASSGTVLAVAALLALLSPVEPASADALHSTASSTASFPASPLFDLAEGEEFWGNVAKYGRYFVTVMLGTGYVMVQPLVAAFKRPVTAIVAIVGIGGGAVLLKFTLDAMLGIQEPFAYEPGNIVPYN